MRFKKRPQLPGAGRARAGHHHGSHTSTSPEAVLLGKMAYHTKQICWQCKPYTPQRIGIAYLLHPYMNYLHTSYSMTTLLKRCEEHMLQHNYYLIRHLFDLGPLHLCWFSAIGPFKT